MRFGNRRFARTDVIKSTIVLVGDQSSSLNVFTTFFLLRRRGQRNRRRFSSGKDSRDGCRDGKSAETTTVAGEIVEIDRINVNTGEFRTSDEIRFQFHRSVHDAIVRHFQRLRVVEENQTVLLLCSDQHAFLAQRALITVLTNQIANLNERREENERVETKRNLLRMTRPGRWFASGPAERLGRERKHRFYFHWRLREEK